MSATSILIAYILLATSHCLLADRKATFRLVTKPILMPVLILYYLLSGGDNNWVYLALIGAWVGDIALLKFSQRAVITGLVSFLAGHIAMVLAIYGLIPTTAEIPWTGIIIAKLSLAIGAFWYLKPHLGSLKPAVLIYCLVLASKGIVAVGLLLAVNSNAALMVAMGALIFMLSDLLLAINRFAMSINKAHLWVMSTYTTAQALIVTGILLVG